MQHAHVWPETATFNAQGHLTLGGCDVVELANQYGTPLYLLDEATFRNNCRAYRTAIAQGYAGPGAIHYAGKALLNTAIAQLVAQEHLGLDVVSGGELFVALRAGFPAAHIHLHGNAKPCAELERALEVGVGRIVVDTLDELRELAALSATLPSPQAILLRLAPDVAANTHAHIETGRAVSKFGLPLDALDAAASLIAAAPGLRLAGLHCHLGSQIFEQEPFVQAIGVLLDCAVRLRDQHGIQIDEISPGGGLGVPYVPEQQLPDRQAFVAMIGQAMQNGCQQRNLPLLRLVLEPGRSIVARAGVTIYRILASKPLPGQQTAERYLHIDGGMADNIRPSLYGARYTAVLANRVGDTSHQQVVHIAGRYCESGDVLIHNLSLPQAELGDLLAVATTGAYTLSMASNYNLTTRPAVVLVGDQRAQLIQRRETYEDLVQRDVPISPIS
jgi:diaminopimelate decarboxylase